MVIQNVNANNCTPQTIVIGRRTTYDTLQVVFDLNYLVETYGSGAAVLVVKRSQDETAYPATITQDGNTLTWTISETDTYYVGAGECELMWYVNNGLAKTIIYPVVVMRDILQTAEEPPDAYENWVEHLTELGAETQQHALDAAQSAAEAETAQGKAEDAQSAAEDAADRAEEAVEAFTHPTASAETLAPDAPATAAYNDGHFTFGIPKGDTGDPAVVYELQPSVSAIKYNPNAAAGSRLTPSSITVQVFKTVGGTRQTATVSTLSLYAGSSGTSAYDASQVSLALDEAALEFNQRVQAVAEESNVVAQITIPIISDGATGPQGPQGPKGDKGDPGASDAGNVTYDPSVTYPAGSIGAEVSDQKNAIRNYNAYDILADKITRTSGTHNGFNFAWSGDVCTVTGSATGYGVNILIAPSDLPATIVPGDTYYIKYKTTDARVRLRVVWRTAADAEIRTDYFTTDAQVTVPTTAERWTVGLFINNNVTLTDAVTVSGIAMLNTLSNADLNDTGIYSRGLVAENTDIDTIKQPGVYLIGPGTYTHAPFPGESNVLLVYKPSDSTVVQIAVNVVTRAICQRCSLNGVFPATWVDSGLSSHGIVPNNTDLDTVRDQGIWFLNSGLTYTHSPYSSVYGGMMLVFRFDANNFLQIATKANSGDVYTRSSLLGNFPATWGNNGTNITNTYVSEHYDNTYNITCSPTITTDTNNFLASTGDYTDRTGDIQTMLNTTGICRLGPGRFVVTGVDVPDYAALIGSGNRTVLILDGSVTTGYAVKLNNQSTVENLRINGGTTAQGSSSTVGTRHGILFEGTKVSGQTGGVTKKKSIIDKCIINNFSGGGITLTGTGVDLDSNLMISNCFVDHCGAGLYIPYYSEFHRITNCAFTYNYYGCVDNGGNNNFANCDFSGNKVGILIDNSTYQSVNNSHGSFVGCSINHSYSDAGVINHGTAIKLLKANIGEIFSGCQIFYGAIEIDGSVGIRFDAANIGSAVPITVTGSTVVTFSECTFKDSTSSPLTQSGNVTLLFKNCYLQDGTIYNPTGEDIPQDYDDLVNDVVQLQTDVDGLEITTSNLSNAIGQKQDATSYVTLSGTIVTQTGADNTMYLCGELAELTFTAPATGQTAIRFTSGTTPTVATFSGVTWLNGFDPSAIEASKTYEINILNGLGCAAWT